MSICVVLGTRTNNAFICRTLNVLFGKHNENNPSLICSFARISQGIPRNRRQSQTRVLQPWNKIYLRYGANLSLCCCYSHESGQIKFILLIYLFTTVCDYTYYTCTSKPPSHSTNTIHQQHNFYLSLGLETPSSNKSQRKNEERMMLWCLLFSWKGRKKMVLLFNSFAKSNNRTS